MQQTTVNKRAALLPCTIVDECYNVGDLKHNRPLVYYYGLSLKGTLDQEILTSALSATLHIYDKCNYVLAPKSPSRGRWSPLVWKLNEVAGSGALRVLRTEELGIQLSREPHHYLNVVYEHSIDISRETGIKVFWINEKDDTLLLFAFHHAITDGRGAVNFMETLLSEYNAIHSNNQTKSQNSKGFTDLDNLYLPTWRQSVRLWKSFSSAVRHQRRALKEPLVRIAPKSHVRGEEKMVIGRKIEGAELEKIMAFAKEKSVPFYDMLLAGLYYAVRTWNDSLGTSSSGRISLYTTVGLRRRDDKSLGNFSGGIHISFSGMDEMDRMELMGSILKKRVFLLKNNAHLLPLSLLSAFALVPARFRRRIMKWAFRGARSGQGNQLATIRVTNLADLEVANAGGAEGAILGDAQLERSYFFPAVVNEVPSLLFLTCERKVYMHLAVLASTFSYESGKEFLDLLVREMSTF